MKSTPRGLSSAPESGKWRANKWLALGVVTLGIFIYTLDSGMVGIGFPALIEAFDSDASTVVWVMNAFFATSVALLLTAAWFSDVFGRKRLFIAGLVLFLLALSGISFSPNIGVLLMFRVLQAAGGSLILANGNAIATQSFTAAERGKAMGIIGASIGLGLGLGPWLGGTLLDALDWRALFWTRIPLGVVGIALAAVVLAPDRGLGKRVQMDYLGPVALCAALVTALLAINLSGRLGADHPIVWGLAAGLPFLIALVISVERRAPRPVLDLALFSNRVFSVSQASQILHYIPSGMMTFLGAFFLLDGLELSATSAGLVLTMFPLVRVVGSPASGIISDRLGTRWPTTLGMAVMGIGFLSLYWVGPGTSMWLVAAALALAGIGAAVWEAPNTADIMGSVNPDRLSAASASLAVGRQIALSSGFALGGAVYALREAYYAERVASDQAIASAFNEAMLLAAVILFAGTAVTYMRGRV